MADNQVLEAWAQRWLNNVVSNHPHGKGANRNLKITDSGFSYHQGRQEQIDEWRRSSESGRRAITYDSTSAGSPAVLIEAREGDTDRVTLALPIRKTMLGGCKANGPIVKVDES